MATEINYKRMLGDLKTRLSELDIEREQVVSAIKVLAPLAGIFINEESALPGLLVEEETIQIAPNEFSNDTIAGAVERYLKTVGKPQTVKNICEALKRGGLQSDAKDLYNTIHTTITRNTNRFIKTNDGWALPEWQQE